MQTQAQEKPKHGVYIKVLEADENDFGGVCSALEEGIARSSLKLVGKWDLDTANPYDYLARVYVLNDSAFTAAVAQLEGPRFLAVAHRIAVYQGPGQKSVLVNMVNPEAIARVYFHKLPEDQYQQMLQKAAEVRQQMTELIISSVPGKEINQETAPLREEKALNGYNGDGMAKVMALFKDFEGSLHKVRNEKIKDDVDASFERVCQELEANFAKSKTGWRLVAKIDGGNHRRYYGISQPYTEEIATRIVGEKRKNDADPAPGIDHSPAFPIEVLVYPEKDKIKVATLGEMWRMQFYFWDAGYAAFAKHAQIPSQIYGSIVDAIKGKK
ncbi:MAG: hypothetical protein D6743_19460 [Calditrichaeota bacterium]|nr:MAG: hypothetical protein D6743_19460 [Calditrichota bacterium]